MRDVNQATIEILKGFEGIEDGDPSTVNLDPYLDPVGIATIGWGHAITVDGYFLRGPSGLARARQLFPGGITMDQAEQLLHADLITARSVVSSHVHVALTDNQFGALCTFVFNIGAGNFQGSELLKLLNAGDYEGAKEQFGHWVYAAGKISKGLRIRRAKEAELFATPDAAEGQTNETPSSPGQ